MKTIYTAEVISEGGRTGTVESAEGNLNLKLASFPDKVGQKPEGTNPEQLFAAAYAACFHGALRAALDKAHLASDGSTVTARVTLKQDDQSGYQLGVELRASLPGINRGEAEKLLKQAHQTCPYSKAVAGNVDVELTLN